MIYDVLDDELFDNTQTANFAHQGCISLIKKLKYSNIVKLYYNFKFYCFLFEYILNVFIPVKAKLTFQHHYSSVKRHMILQK